MIRVLQWLGFYVVDESIQASGSFKSRGVAEQLRTLFGVSKNDEPLVTFTSGNHGISVALEAQRLQRRSIVVVPSWIEPMKRDLLRRLGSEVVVGGEAATTCEQAAIEISGSVSGVLVHPFRSTAQIRGYMSLWREIAKEFPQGADVVVPVGSGGLLAAGVLYRRESGCNYRIVGVEPDRCSTLAEALSSGRPKVLHTRSDVAPGLNVNTTPDEVFSAIRETASLELVRVSDEEMLLCINYMAAKGVSIDPASSSVFACALLRRMRWTSENVVLVLTGRGPQAALSAMDRMRDDNALFLRWIDGHPPASVGL